MPGHGDVLVKYMHAKCDVHVLVAFIGASSVTLWRTEHARDSLTPQNLQPLPFHCFLNACHINFSIQHQQCLYYFSCSTRRLQIVLLGYVIIYNKMVKNDITFATFDNVSCSKTERHVSFKKISNRCNNLEGHSLEVIRIGSIQSR